MNQYIPIPHIASMPDRTILWRHNSTTGLWYVARACLADEAAQWLAIFQKDEPQAWFKLSMRRPRACGNRSAS